jgi:hypothetical protein
MNCKCILRGDVKRAWACSDGTGIIPGMEPRDRPCLCSCHDAKATPPQPSEGRMFPVMYQRKDAPGPTRIPWSVADKAYSAYSARYGHSQSLERLAERGGFGAGELDMFVPGWREEVSELAALRSELATEKRISDKLRDREHAAKVDLAEVQAELAKVKADHVSACKLYEDEIAGMSLVLDAAEAELAKVRADLTTAHQTANELRLERDEAREQTAKVREERDAFRVRAENEVKDWILRMERASQRAESAEALARELGAALESIKADAAHEDNTILQCIYDKASAALSSASGGKTK